MEILSRTSRAFVWVYVSVHRRSIAKSKIGRIITIGITALF